jgi:2-alkenal reductase
MKTKKIVVWMSLAVFVISSMACSFSLPFAVQPVQPSSVAGNNEQPAVQVPTPTPLALPAPVLDEQGLLVELYARANPAVVNITEYVKEGTQVVPQGQGSGFVYDDLGHIVTNAHVVHGSDQLEVTFSDGTILTGELIGEDLNSDLAVVKVDHLPQGVQPLPLGDIEELAVGQTVVAIGNPFGLEGTLTRGIISALGRSIPALTPFTIPQAIQTDAAINPGNSGGPLLNLQGEVIGVNAQIETGGTSRSNSGVGFAIPVSIIKRVVPDLIEKGKHEWAWLGVRGGSLNPLVREAMKLEVDKGAYIAEVITGGPSAKAGLRGSKETIAVNGREIEIGGDVIIAVNGKSIRSFDDLLIFVSLEAKPGDTVVLTVLRDGKTIEVKVVLGTRPSDLAE